MKLVKAVATAGIAPIVSGNPTTKNETKLKKKYSLF
jgi:hypothetical protein